MPNKTQNVRDSTTALDVSFCFLWKKAQLSYPLSILDVYKMILFFGTKLGKKTVKKLRNVACPHCSQIGTLNAIIQPNHFHLFWIPLFKIGTSRYAECSHCKRVFYKEEFSPEMKKEISN